MSNESKIGEKWCNVLCNVCNVRAQQWAHTLGSMLYERSARATAITDIKTVSVFVRLNVFTRTV